jgi:dolichol kinase
MSMLQSEIKSGRKEAARSVAGTATAIAVAALAILALLGTHVGVIAILALLVLGTILILNDRSITVEPHIMLT